MTDELLTPAEHDAIAQTADLWKTLCAITADGPARDGDLRELIFHIHGIQRAVLKQAAARAYPDLYRLLGGDPPRARLDGGCTNSETCTAAVHVVACPSKTRRAEAEHP